MKKKSSYKWPCATNPCCPRVSSISVSIGAYRCHLKQSTKTAFTTSSNNVALSPTPHQHYQILLNKVCFWKKKIDNLTYCCHLKPTPSSTEQVNDISLSCCIWCISRIFPLMCFERCSSFPAQLSRHHAAALSLYSSLAVCHRPLRCGVLVRVSAIQAVLCSSCWVSSYLPYLSYNGFSLFPWTKFH